MAGDPLRHEVQQELQIALEENDLARVKELVEEDYDGDGLKADINAPYEIEDVNDGNEYPIQIALNAANLETGKGVDIVKYLLKKGVDTTVITTPRTDDDGLESDREVYAHKLNEIKTELSSKTRKKRGGNRKTRKLKKRQSRKSKRRGTKRV